MSKRPFAALSLVALLAALTAFSPLFGARLGVIDDHEIARFLGPDGAVPLAAIPAKIAQSEAGHPGRTKRYRPVAYSLKVLEASAWGDRAGLWYAARMLVYAFAFAVFGAVAAAFFGLPVAVLFSLIAFSRSYWADIFARLGPSEAQACLGLSLAVLGLLLRHKSMARPWAAPLIAGGVAVAVGSKENFAFLALLPLALLWVDRARNTPADWAAYGLSLLAALFVAGAVAVAVFADGADVYGRSTGLGVRLGELGGGLMRKGGWVWLPVLAFGAWRAWHLRAEGWHLPSRPVRRMDGMPLLLILAGLFTLYASQVFLYGTEMGGRYRFPAYLAKDFAILFCVIRLFDLYAAPIRFARPLALAAGLAAAIIAGDQLLELRQTASRMAAVTIRFDRSLTEAVTAIRRRPAAPVVLVSHEPLSYEPIESVISFLRMRGVDNPVALELQGYAPEAIADPALRHLAEIQRAVETGGASGAPYLEGVAVLPLQAVDRADCVQITFRDTLLTPACPSTVRIRTD